MRQSRRNPRIAIAKAAGLEDVRLQNKPELERMPLVERAFRPLVHGLWRDSQRARQFAGVVVVRRYRLLLGDDRGTRHGRECKRTSIFIASILSAGQCKLAYMKSVWDRIQHACDTADPPVVAGKELADRIGVAPQAVYQWRDKGDAELKGSVLVALARTLNASAEWIMTGRGAMRSSNPLDGHTIVRFNRDARVGAGNPAINDTPFARIGGIAFLEESLRRKGINPETSWAIRVRGPSMQPRLRDGDTIVYDESDVKVTNGAMYVIEHPLEGLLVKRLFREIDGRLRISSDNPDPRYADEYVAPDASGFRIVGKVRWVGSWEER